MRRESTSEKPMCAVEILLATYNGERYLEEQLNSIRTQSFPDWCLLASDDGSTDDTYSILRKFADMDPRLTICEQSDNAKGATDNFMGLLQHSTAEYVMFCDQDDVWLQNKVEKTLERMRQLEKDQGKDHPCLVFTDSSVVDCDLRPVAESFVASMHLDPNSVTLPQICNANVVQGCTMMLNRPLVNRVCEARRPSCFAYHDHWIAAVALAIGALAFIDEPTMMYRQHSNNVVGHKAKTSLVEAKIDNCLNSPGKARLLSKNASDRIMFSYRAEALLDSVSNIPSCRHADLTLLASFKEMPAYQRLGVLHTMQIYGEIGFIDRILKYVGALAA